jgi:hypothetical protein
VREPRRGQSSPLKRRVHGSDPGDNLPKVIVGFDGFTKGRHRPNDKLRPFSAVTLLLEFDGAKRDQSEQCVVIVAVDPDWVGERGRHPAAAAAAAGQLLQSSDMYILWPSSAAALECE